VPKKIYAAVRGFDIVPEGKDEEIRVEVGDPAPYGLSKEQVERLIDRGLLEAK
jgi:precorrin-4 methylase